MSSCYTDLLGNMERDPACKSHLQPLLYYKGFHALQGHRVAHWYWQQGKKERALLLQSTISQLLAVDIHPAAVIGNGIVLDHATGIVVGETSVVGNNCTILHNVTLGGRGNGTVLSEIVRK